MSFKYVNTATHIERAARVSSLSVLTSQEEHLFIIMHHAGLAGFACQPGRVSLRDNALCIHFVKQFYQRIAFEIRVSSSTAICQPKH